MNPPILNREFKHPSDGWYHIEPKGEHVNAASGVVQVIDEAACAAIANRFNADADAGPNFPGMLVDHEHFRHDLDKETRAFGWLMRLQNRADGLYGQIRWTTTGQAAVDGGDYRFFSTEYAGGDLEVLNRGQKPARVRPLRLDGLTLTNNPNNRGQRPITNRDPAFRHGAGAPPADNQTPNPKTNPMKNALIQLLGLSADATDEQIVTGATALKNRAVDAEKAIDPLKARNTALEAENKSILESQADADLAPFRNRLSEADLATLRAQLIANRSATLPLLKLVAPAASQAPATQAAAVLNRSQTQTPKSDPANPVLPEVQIVKLVTDFRVKNRCTFEQAWTAVRQANPDLFKQIPA